MVVKVRENICVYSVLCALVHINIQSVLLNLHWAQAHWQPVFVEGLFMPRVPKILVVHVPSHTGVWGITSRKLFFLKFKHPLAHSDLYRSNKTNIMNRQYTEQ